MNNASGICSVDAIERFLENRLNPDEQNELELHLDACNDCCEQLQWMTANAKQWSHVKEHLGDAGFDLSNIAPEERSEISLDFLKPTDDPHRLGRFAGYEIAGVVGQGGMGIVMKGFDRALNRYVAIKVLLPHYACSSAARKRFAREAKAAAAVVHENVIEIYGVSVDEDRETLPYLVMPYIRGESLQKRLDCCGTLTVAETLRISIQIATGLAAAHEQGLVHRDIKPANILLLDNVERVKITDFGLARAADDASLTRTGVIAGTPQYMSPEQAEGGKVTCQSDLFSLGSVMYLMCSGLIPFRAESPMTVLRRIIDDTPRPIQQINPDVPAWLCGIIEKLLHKKPDQRFESAGELSRILRQCLAHVQQPDAVELPPEIVPSNQQNTSTESSLRNRLIKGVFVMASVLLLGMMGWMLVDANLQAPNPNSLNGQMNGVVIQESQPFKKRFTAEFANLERTRTLNVDIKRGSINVIGHEGDNVIVNLEVPNYMQKSTSNEGLREVRSNNLDFDITSNDNHIKVDSNSRRYITNLQIKVPRNCNLKLDSYQDGNLKVRDVHGHLDVRSFHSNISLTDCSGSASLYSYHGNLQADLSSVDSHRPLEFESYNGSIDLSLPADIHLDTQLRTVHGKVLTDFDITESVNPVRKEVQNDGTKKVEFDKYVRGTINGGGVNLRAEAQHEDIRIRKRMSTSVGTTSGKELGQEADQRLGKKLGQEWNEKIGRKLGEQIDEKLNPQLGKEWNEKLGEKLGREWTDRLNGKTKDGGKPEHDGNPNHDR